MKENQEIRRSGHQGKKEIENQKRHKTIKVKIKGKFIPHYQSEEAAGCDLYADIDKEIMLRPGNFCVVPTGIRVVIPAGYEAQVRPRSGLARKYGIGVLNSPGTIDADYRGEIQVILFNFGKKSFKINKGDRIAQLVFNRIIKVTFESAKQLKRTKRGGGGFGHTGT